MGDELLVREQQALVDPKTLRPRGYENFEQEDLILPRIAIGQAMSKVVQDGEVKNGALYNTLSKESYLRTDGNPSLDVIVILFNKSRRLWDKDNKDSSICMSLDGKISTGKKICMSECPFTRAEVSKDVGVFPNATAFEWGEDNKGQRLSPACTLYYNYLSILTPFEKANLPVSVSLGRTSAKAAKQFNSLIAATDEDIFARVYTLSTEKKVNKKGSFYAYKIRMARRPTMPEYRRAEEIAVKLSTMKYTIHEEGVDEGTKNDDEIPF